MEARHIAVSEVAPTHEDHIVRAFAPQQKQHQSRVASHATPSRQTASGASHQAPSTSHLPPITENQAAPRRLPKAGRSDLESRLSFDEKEAPGVVQEVLHSPGEPIEASTRAFFELRFGNDFSRVRVHTDARAAESAQVVKARAYAVGHDVVFAAGQYAPRTAAGRQLLAHELAHTVQQSGASAALASAPALASVPPISRPHAAAEREAHAAAEAVSGGLAFAVTPQPRQIARDAEPSPADQEQNEPEGPHACVFSAEIAKITTPVAVFDDMVMMRTDVDIEWKPPQSWLEPIKAMTYCNCACGEYRQYVKGHIIKNGQRFNIGLCDGATLQEDTYQEDGDPAKGLCYGHRDHQESKNDIFDQPNREWGCHYHGKDEPSVPGKAGDMIDVDLKYKGQTYDTCLDKFGQIHEWAFTYKGPLGGV